MIVLHDDIEAWTVQHLKAALAARGEPYTDDVTVTITLDARPGRAVVIRGDGGPRLDPVRKVERVGVNVYADTVEDVNDLARMVGALLEAAPDGRPVCKAVVTGGPYGVPDDSGPHSYLAVEFVVRGHTA